MAVFLFNDPLNRTNFFCNIFLCIYQHWSELCVHVTCLQNLLQIHLHFASNTVFHIMLFCVFFCPCVHGMWREAWKSEKRSAKGYEVERKGTREHLKADFGNVQGQQLPEIVPVTAGYYLTCPWQWWWGRNLTHPLPRNSYQMALD